MTVLIRMLILPVNLWSLILWPVNLWSVNLCPVNLCPVNLWPVNLRLVKFLSGLIFLTCAQLSYAQAEALPIEMIELLGELDDEDGALDTALTEIELEKSKVITPPNEVKK